MSSTSHTCLAGVRFSPHPHRWVLEFKVCVDTAQLAVGLMWHNPHHHGGWKVQVLVGPLILTVARLT